MRLMKSQRAPLLVLFILGLAAAICCEAQTTPASSTQVVPPAGPSSPARVAPSEPQQWSSLGATAQCNDGTFFHGKVDSHSCEDHGGVRKLLQQPGQELIR
jgi:hypothetical protein